jgi:phosphoribosyl 1,2-cyclic phosphate phosphodiesterase
MLVQRVTGDQTTSVLIDTSPDMRNQLLDAQISTLDAVVYTHDHADHMHGIDDLRMVVINRRERLPVYSDAPTKASLMTRFAYAFETPEGSSYPPILVHKDLGPETTIDGAGGPITFEAIPVEHGHMNALGFRIGGLAYIPDVSDIPETSWPLLQGLDIWVLDALRRTPHPSHSHLENSIEWIARAAPKQAVLTNMHTDLDYSAVAAETAENILPAFDGMQLRLSI